MFCGAGRECAVTEKGEPSCLCIEVSEQRSCRSGTVGVSTQHRSLFCSSLQSCKPHKRSVCGSNGKTYRNHCELHRDACLTGLKIQVAHDGHCKGRAHQTEIFTQLLWQLCHRKSLVWIIRKCSYKYIYLLSAFHSCGSTKHTWRMKMCLKTEAGKWKQRTKSTGHSHKISTPPSPNCCSSEEKEKVVIAPNHDKDHSQESFKMNSSQTNVTDLEEMKSSELNNPTSSIFYFTFLT